MQNTVTDTQIAKLCHEAATAGDYRQVQICQIALGHTKPIRRMSREQAREECTRVIQDAQAQQ